MPERFFSLYDPGKIALPLIKEDDLDDVPAMARDWALSPPDHELITSRKQWPFAVQGYLASISYCDFIIGKIIAALDASGLADNTAIFLWGDNGFHLGEKLHWRKFVLWEEATRVPLVVVPPNSRQRHVRMHEPVSLIDICPTLLELCGAQSTTAFDGHSLAPCLFGAQMQRKKPVTMTWGQGNHSIRTLQWRYTRYRDGTEELYDSIADPYEWTNLADVAEFECIIQELSAYV